MVSSAPPAEAPPLKEPVKVEETPPEPAAPAIVEAVVTPEVLPVEPEKVVAVVVEEKEEEEAPYVPPPHPFEHLTGQITVVWADMSCNLSINHGKLDVAVVDEELALSFVFPRCELELCLHPPKGVDMKSARWDDLLAKDNYGIFFDLQPGTTYFVLVREHPEEVAKAEAAREEARLASEELMKERRKEEELKEGLRDARLLSTGEDGVSGLHVESSRSMRAFNPD